MVAAGLVLLCQLAAMALVVDGQMNLAQVRDALRISQRTAVIHCMESSLGSTRHSCIEQANALAQDGPVNPGTQALAITEESDITALPPGSAQAFMPAAFSATRQ